MLRDHSFAPSYDKALQDVAGEFYLPCMREARRYDRVSGYFSSAVFAIAWPALKEFVAAGGKMRLICSPIFSGADLGALRQGHAGLSDDDIGNALIKELQVLLASSRSRKPAQVLAGLIAAGIVDLRLAVLSDSTGPGDRRLFHDKVGVFNDGTGDAVGFRGSMNETYLGLAADGNLESIDVFPSWSGGRDELRVLEAQERFERLWRNEVASVRVRPVPEVAAKVMREAGPEDWEVLVDEVVAEAAVRAATPPAARPMHDHQIAALAAWELRHRRGLLEHATGSGKTYTATRAVRTVLTESGTAIVLVPSALLLRQWNAELSQHLADLNPQILLVGDGHDAWRREELLGPWTSPGGNRPRIVVAMMQSAATDAFLSRVTRSDQLLVVADEAHRLGSPTAQSLLTLDAPYRLGLSATPRRAGDAEGTDRLLNYFGGVLAPPYTLSDAIRDRILTPYNFLPHDIALDAAEQATYEDLTRKIRREAGRASAALEDLGNSDRLRQLAIARARVLKRASGKVLLAVRVLREHWQPGQRWLVYCDGLRQLRQVRASLAQAGLDTLEYHSAMAGDRSATLTELELNGGILVSVRCLDEGVDLPAVSHALILASSRNPREFIQRRGRILRKHHGKTLAYLHDAVVVPAQTSEPPPPGGDRLLMGELQRVMEFARGAANPQVLTQVEALCIQFGIPVLTEEQSLGAAATGVEFDDEEDDNDD